MIYWKKCLPETSKWGDVEREINRNFHIKQNKLHIFLQIQTHKECQDICFYILDSILVLLGAVTDRHFVVWTFVNCRHMFVLPLPFSRPTGGRHWHFYLTNHSLLLSASAIRVTPCCLCACMWVCMYTVKRVSVCACACACLYVCKPEDSLRFHCFFLVPLPHFLRQGLLLEWARVPQGPAYFLFPALRLQARAQLCAFWGSKSGTHAGGANALLAESFTQPTPLSIFVTVVDTPNPLAFGELFCHHSLSCPACLTKCHRHSGISYLLCLASFYYDRDGVG